MEMKPLQAIPALAALLHCVRTLSQVNIIAGWRIVSLAVGTLSVALAVFMLPNRTHGEGAAPPTEAKRLAAPVPTLILIERNKGELRVAEVGDAVEVRLTEDSSSNAAWTLREARGTALRFVEERTETRKKSEGDTAALRVFRFYAAAVGHSELNFVRGASSLKFVVEIR